MRGQEVLSGAQRIHIHKLLTERIREHGMSPDSDGPRDYVGGFKYGRPPHSGGGIGLERIVQFYLGLPNIRMASLFPRDPSRVLPWIVGNRCTVSLQHWMVAAFGAPAEAGSGMKFAVLKGRSVAHGKAVNGLVFAYRV
jgi:hypothetical protein